MKERKKEGGEIFYFPKFLKLLRFLKTEKAEKIKQRTSDNW
jgi:hypothetical protein